MTNTTTTGGRAPASSSTSTTLARVSLTAAGVSLLGIATLFIGHLADPSTFNAGKHPGAANNVAFAAYILGMVVAVILGASIWTLTRRAHASQAQAHAKAATITGGVLLIVGIITAALGG